MSFCPSVDPIADSNCKARLLQSSVTWQLQAQLSILLRAAVRTSWTRVEPWPAARKALMWNSLILAMGSTAFEICQGDFAPTEDRLFLQISESHMILGREP